MKASNHQKSCVSTGGVVRISEAAQEGWSLPQLLLFAQVLFYSSGLSGKSAGHRFRRWSIGEDFTHKTTSFKIDNVFLFKGINE